MQGMFNLGKILFIFICLTNIIHIYLSNKQQHNLHIFQFPSNRNDFSSHGWNISLVRDAAGDACFIERSL